MKHRRTITVTAILLCALALTGCQGSVAGQNGESDTAAQSQEENQNPQNLDEMQASAALIGSVSDFQDGSFQVVPEQSTEDTAIQAAAG